MPQIFSAEQIRLNNMLLTGNAASPRLYYNGSGLLFVGEASAGSVSSTRQVLGGSGLANRNGQLDLSADITLDIVARSGVFISGSAIIVKFDNSTIGIDATEKLRTLKVPNALSNGLGIDTLSYDGSATASVKVDSSQVVMMTGAQTIGGDKVFSNNVRIAGNLNVDGSVTTVSSELVTIADNIILLNSNVSGAVSPTENAGIEIARGNQTYADLIWNETSGKWQAGLSGAAYNIITENRLQAIKLPLSTNDVSKTINYNPITTSLSGFFVANGTLASTGVNPDIIGCLLSGSATATTATFYFTAPIPNNFYLLNAIIMGL